MIVNTGKGHADLSQEYSEIPAEMKAAAKALGVELLHESTLDELLAHVNEIEDDRAVLRAIHFFEETRRVEDAAEAIGKEDYEKFMKLMDESGNSSWELLQNVTPAGAVEAQDMAIALTAAEIALHGRGACRVHGGGFAGTIQAFVPLEDVLEFKKKMEAMIGEGCCHVLDIRPIGGTVLSLD